MVDGLEGAVERAGASEYGGGDGGGRGGGGSYDEGDVVSSFGGFVLFCLLFPFGLVVGLTGLMVELMWAGAFRMGQPYPLQTGMLRWLDEKERAELRTAAEAKQSGNTVSAVL